MRGGFVPGDVADVLNEYGVWNRAIYSVKPEGFVWQYGVADSTAPKTAEARPLVVIDIEDAATLDALGKAWDEAESCDLDNEQPMTMRALRMRVALRSLIADPKPDEPQGLGAVVEDDKGALWTRAARIKHGWHRPVGFWATYEDINAVRVLSEGVS